MQRRRPGTQRGVSIIEALVAFLILSMGLLAFARVQSELRFGADLSRQRAEAVRLAQENMEQLRAYSVLPTTSGLTSFDGNITAISSAAPQTLTLANVNTTFQLNRTVNDETDALGATIFRRLALRVTWTDRRGGAQEVVLNSVIAREDPRDSGNLSVTSPASTARSPMNRDVRIPIDAVDLGNRESGFKLPGTNSFLVFNSDSAAIVKTCTFGNGASQLQANDANNAYAHATCTERSGYLIKGFVRFDIGNNPSSISPGSTACEFYNAIAGGAVRSGNNYDCSGVSVANLLDATMSSGAGYLPANPPSGWNMFDCYDDFADRVRANSTYVNYYCAVYIPPVSSSTPTPSWSGQALLSVRNNASPPQNILGTTNATYRNCRYSADYNSSGAIDPWEHPYSYSNVAESLTAQNFILVVGNQNCPTGTDRIGNSGLNVNYQTCRQQPDPGNANCNQ